MLLSSGMSVVLLSFRMYMTGQPAYIFLCWNLFLAWIPFLCALCLDEVREYPRRKLLRRMIFLVWLVFFPNSPYIITDLFHLHPRPGMPLWFDLFLLISFAWNGLMLGFASLMVVQRWMSYVLSARLNWILVGLLMFACGYGVYLGRFERWNSWDVLAQGGTLGANIFHQVIDPFSNPRMLGVTLVYGTFLLLGYLTLLALINTRENGK